jgi:hypothetical protein
MQSTTAWSQQSTGNTEKCFPKWFSSHRIISRDDFGTGSMHRLAQHFPKQPRDSSTRVQHRDSGSGMRSRVCLEQTQTHSSGHGCTRFLQTNTCLTTSEMNQSNLVDGVPVLRSKVSVRMERSPLTAYFLRFICMHQG